ncbi:hypothetical protein CP972_30475 [Streptomyces prasinus]|uniref:Uncharacterized protein n=1 Tax=Streptomyces prasinus TaxID=67345 RepID=A0ABX6B5G4_9ACTN|nr:hypothetical protein CP972_30475 [Streptomyces prasinus]
MSLPTEVFVREPDGDVRRLGVPEDFHQSAGFESWPTETAAPLGRRPSGAADGTRGGAAGTWAPLLGTVPGVTPSPPAPCPSSP